jgi:hypothetical protein
MSKRVKANPVTFQEQPVQEQEQEQEQELEPEQEKLPLTTTETHFAPEKTTYLIFKNI